MSGDDDIDDADNLFSLPHIVHSAACAVVWYPLVIDIIELV